MKRWLLWTLVCRRGKKCANLVMDGFGPVAGQGLDDDEMEEVRRQMIGGVVVMDYECAACGTRYRTTALVGATGLMQTNRERI